MAAPPAVNAPPGHGSSIRALVARSSTARAGAGAHRRPVRETSTVPTREEKKGDITGDREYGADWIDFYQDLIHAESGGYPWGNYDLLWERSPLRHVKKAKTPLLLIHGENDNDVHITQAEEMYTALRMRGIEAVLVRYPREGHGLREPAHRVDSLNRTIEWFDRHLK
ncbi:MAG TPA: prolyl oligopeptidase family serine peptidase [Blastocatellia bacterium]|nr:prolyl oligopeptidase family serine peptidase [Blastocatellia bacterium]